MSPYLSSNIPWAPLSFASSVDISWSSTERDSEIFSLISFSTFCFSSSVSFLSKLKSNLRRSGVMLDPLWDISLSFKTSLSASFRRCAAVCSFVVASELSARPDLNFPTEAVLESSWCFCISSLKPFSSSSRFFSSANSFVISIGKP